MMGKQNTQMQTLILYLDAMIPSNHLLKQIKDVLKTCGKSARLWCLSTGPPLYTPLFYATNSRNFHKTWGKAVGI